MCSISSLKCCSILNLFCFDIEPRALVVVVVVVVIVVVLEGGGVVFVSAVVIVVSFDLQPVMFVSWST